MKTPSAESEPERTVTFTIHLGEAMLLVRAFDFYKWKQPYHRDCGPTEMRDLINVIQNSIREADPDNAKFIFDDMAFLKHGEPLPIQQPGTIIREVHHHHYHEPVFRPRLDPKPRIIG